MTAHPVYVEEMRTFGDLLDEYSSEDLMRFMHLMKDVAHKHESSRLTVLDLIGTCSEDLCALLLFSTTTVFATELETRKAGA